MDKKPTRSPLTPEARAAQQRLLRLWRVKRDELDLRQSDISHKTGWAQSVVSQYLRGHISLNTDAVLRFARALDVNPDEIWPGLMPSIQPIEDTLSPDVIVLAREIERLSPRNREVVQSVIERFALAQHAQE